MAMVTTTKAVTTTVARARMYNGDCHVGSVYGVRAVRPNRKYPHTTNTLVILRIGIRIFTTIEQLFDLE